MDQHEGSSLAPLPNGYQRRLLSIPNLEAGQGDQPMTITYLYKQAGTPVVVLIPGSFNDHRDWLNVASYLDDQFSIMIIHLPGHAGSAPKLTDGSIELYTRVILRVVQHENIHQFYIGGHSLGGMIALEAGRQARTEIQGLIVCEGWTHYGVESATFAGLKTNTLDEVHMEQYRRQRQELMADWTETEISEFSQIWTRWDGYDILRTTELPVLELWGDRGLRPRPSQSQMRIPDRPNIEVVWFENGSHYLTLQFPREVAQAIARFINRIER